MNRESGDYPCNLKNAWLDAIEEKLTNSFQELHDVFLGIIEECLKTSANYTYICKGSGKENEIDLSGQRKRYDSKFSLNINAWKDKFYRLRKKYKQLKGSSDQPGIRKKAEKRKKKDRKSCSDEFKFEKDKISRNQKFVAGERVEQGALKGNGSSSSETILSDVVVANESGNKEAGSMEAERIEKNAENVPHFVLPSKVDKSIDIFDTEHENVEVISKQASKEYTAAILRSDEPLSPSWKSSSRVVLHGKHNVKVRYLDNSRKQSMNKSIDEFFKPRPVSKVQGITSRRAKRQIAESSVELPQKKKIKEGKTEPVIDTGSLLMIYCDDRESMVDVENPDVGTQLLVQKSDILREKESCKTNIAECDLKKRIKLDNGKEEFRCSVAKSRADRQRFTVSGDTTETISIVDDIEDTNAVGVCPSTADKMLQKHRKRTSSHPKANYTDATYWGFDDRVGLPSLASTPMVHTENDAKICPNGKDFDDTMWSAPESPSVVRSIFSSPERTSDCEISAENKKIVDENAKFKVPTREAMPILLKESQPYMIEVSHESMYKSRRDNLTHLKISEADLSGDMFFGNTEIMENIEEERDQRGSIRLTEKVTEKSEHEEVKKHAKLKLDDDDSSFQSSQERQKEGVKYKYDAVIRKRDERDKLDGYACAECAAWYQDEGDLDERRKHLQNVCRHKAVSSPPPSTPDGFWSIGFPDTPVYMKKGLMLNEDDTLPLHARPKSRKEKNKEKKEKSTEE